MTLTDYTKYLRSLRVNYTQAICMVLLTTTTVAFEGAGFAMLLPIIDYMQFSGDISGSIEKSRIWPTVLSVFEFLGLPVTLFVLLAVSFTFILCRQVLNFLSIVYRKHVVESHVRRLRSLLFKRFLAAQTDTHDRAITGNIVNNFAVEMPRAVHGVYGFADMAGFASTILIYLVGLFLLSAEMTLLCIAINAVAFAAMRVPIRRTNEVGKRLTAANQATSAFLMERLKALRLIRLAGMQKVEEAMLGARTDDQYNQALEITKLVAVLTSFVDPIVVFLGFVLIYVSVELLGTELSVLALFLLVLIRLLPPVKQLVNKHQEILGQEGSMAAIRDHLVEFAAAKENVGGTVKFEGVVTRIEFADVSYRYGNDAENFALENVDVTVLAKKLTALVGPSGAGKSTLIDLLPRLRDPNCGKVLIDDCPLMDFDLASLREGISYVPQTPQMFNVTIAEHIRYGAEYASEDEIRNAAEMAGIAETIQRIPEGYNYLIGEGGNRLSGGQRQRLDLARALVRNAPLLILDEPTSALDAESEEHFRAALERIKVEGRITLLVIAHRLSTVRHADRIVVLERGRVTAVGTHEDLMAAGGWYSDACIGQLIETSVPMEVLHA